MDDSVRGMPGWTDYFWHPSAQRPVLSPRADTLPIPDEEMDAVARRERERHQRGFGFARDRTDRDPLLWDGDGA